MKAFVGARRSAFTLFEVMISLLILTTAILSTIALLPIGLKAQQLARSQVFASAVALTLENDFQNPVPKLANLGQKTPLFNGDPSYAYMTQPWNNVDLTQPPLSYYPNTGGMGWAGLLKFGQIYSSPYQPNIEQLAGWFSGVLIAPPIISRRLDSDNDEIQSLLDQGGALFYPDPNFMQGMNGGAAEAKTVQTMATPEIQKLVFALTTLPQQNVLTSYPSESLPFYETYPFPPQWLSMSSVGTEQRKWDSTLSWNNGWLNGVETPGDDMSSPSGKFAILAEGNSSADWSWSHGLCDV